MTTIQTLIDCGAIVLPEKMIIPVIGLRLISHEHQEGRNAYRDLVLSTPVDVGKMLDVEKIAQKTYENHVDIDEEEKEWANISLHERTYWIQGAQALIDNVAKLLKEPK